VNNFPLENGGQSDSVENLRINVLSFVILSAFFDFRILSHYTLLLLMFDLSVVMRVDFLNFFSG